MATLTYVLARALGGWERPGPAGRLWVQGGTIDLGE